MLYLKLDELIRVSENARNKLLDLEDLTEAELDRLKGSFTKFAGRSADATLLSEAANDLDVAGAPANDLDVASAEDSGSQEEGRFRRGGKALRRRLQGRSGDDSTGDFNIIMSIESTIRLRFLLWGAGFMSQARLRASPNFRASAYPANVYKLMVAILRCNANIKKI